MFVGHGEVTDRCGDVLGEWREEETTCAPWGAEWSRAGHVGGGQRSGVLEELEGVTENLNK